MAAKASVRIDAQLVDEATEILGAQSRTAAVHAALREIVALHRFKQADEEEWRKAKIC